MRVPARPAAHNRHMNYRQGRIEARRCRCGAAVPPARVIQVRVKGIPAGQRHEHACGSCRHTFDVHSLTAMIFALFAALVLTGAGALLTLKPPGTAVGAAESNQWFGVGLLVFAMLAWILVASRVLGRLRYPLVPSTQR
jgi:hypothetical protein